MREKHFPTFYDALPLEVKMEDASVAFVAEDVDNKCENSFLVVLTSFTALKSQPRLIRFNFDAAA